MPWVCPIGSQGLVASPRMAAWRKSRGVDAVDVTCSKSWPGNFVTFAWDRGTEMKNLKQHLRVSNFYEATFVWSYPAENVWLFPLQLQPRD